MDNNNTPTATEVAGPMLEALGRLTAVADWIDGIDLANITNDTRQAVFTVDRAVRDAARVVTLKARCGLRPEHRHLADAIAPLFVALADTDRVLDDAAVDDDVVAGWLRSGSR